MVIDLKPETVRIITALFYKCLYILSNMFALVF